MNLGIIIETNEPEKAWSGVRFVNAFLPHLTRCHRP